MATLYLTVANVTNTTATIHWEISDMDGIITRAGLCSNYPDGTTTSPGVLSSAAASGGAASGNYTASKSKYPDGSLSCYGFGQSTGGYYYSAGGQDSVWWDWSEEPVPDRPPDWVWWWNVVPGERLPTAMEWDAFCERVNAFRAHKKQSQYSFTKTYPGPTTFKAAMVNQAITAIKQMSPPIAPPALTVARETKLSAELLNGLSRSLNSVT